MSFLQIPFMYGEYKQQLSKNPVSLVVGRTQQISKMENFSAIFTRKEKVVKLL